MKYWHAQEEVPDAETRPQAPHHQAETPDIRMAFTKEGASTQACWTLHCINFLSNSEDLPKPEEEIKYVNPKYRDGPLQRREHQHNHVGPSTACTMRRGRAL